MDSKPNQIRIKKFRQQATTGRQRTSSINSVYVVKEVADTTQYALIDIVIHQTTVSARPFEFDNGKATKYATMCPYCAQGIIFTPDDITKNGIRCPECKIGEPTKVPDFIDIFLNPIESKKILESSIDNIANITDLKIKDDGLSALDRIKNQQ